MREGRRRVPEPLKRQLITLFNAVAFFELLFLFLIPFHKHGLRRQVWFGAVGLLVVSALVLIVRHQRSTQQRH